MEQMCFSHFSDKMYTVAYKMWDMKVNIEKRAMQKSNPHLKVFTIRAEDKQKGSQAILNYLMSTEANKKIYCDPVIQIVPVLDGNFEKAFSKYTSI